MLRTLSVRNFAIIDRLDLEFGPGFNVLTGETGAGKSIIMEALNLLLGGRAGAEMVRAGADRATIDAVFEVGGSPELHRLVAEMGFDIEDDQLFVSREVAAGGKSACRLTGRPATVGQLKAVGEWLVDLHGQHEHQSLLAVARHLDMLDDWGGKAVQPLRAEAGLAFQALQGLRREREDLEKDARERAHLLDLYAFQVKEIADGRPAIGEDEELETEHRRVANAQRLGEAALSAANALSGEDGGGILPALAAGVRALEEPATLDPALVPMLEVMRSAAYELTEAERDLTRYQGEIEFDPERLEQISERLETLRTLKRKYGDSIEEILAYEKETAAKLAQLSNSEERGADLDREIRRAHGRLKDICARLTAARAKAGKEFEAVTLSELRDLALEKARFEVHISQGEPTPRGADRVEFLITTNPGEPLRPLAKVASGGEISRVMLAVKAALARQEALPTMVFDEIDVGVGGRTSSVIADKMAALAKSAQILCITHLAQIASRGQHHYYIEKQVEASRTVVSVVPLSPEQRVAEIARMIGGAHLSETVLQHAREMLSLPA